MKFEDYMDNLFEALYQGAREAFKDDVRYVYTNSNIEEIGFEWKKRYSQQEQEYLEECLMAYRSHYMGEERFLYRQGIRDCIALLKHLQVLA